MFNVGFVGGDTLYSPPFERSLDNAAYANLDLYLGSQISSNQARGVEMKPDGTKMYVCDTTGNDIYQYNLSTAFDLSSASYASKTFDVGSQDNDIEGLSIDTTGTKLFIVGSNDRVYYYTLSTAWDISTASYSNTSFSFQSQTRYGSDIWFKADGTRMFIVSRYNGQALSVPRNGMFSYTLSTAWDISTASYDSKYLLMEPESADGNPQAAIITSDGKCILSIDNASGHNKLYKWTMTTPWDLSTGSYDSESLDISSQASSARGLTGNADFSKVYIVNTSSQMYQYTLPGFVAP